MQQVTKAGLLGNAALKGELALLAAVEPTDSPFISCYLDARAGKTACQRFLERKAAVMRPTLSGSARFAFENALAMLQRHLDVHWNAEAQGLAMFARGLAGGRHLSAMHFAVPLENRLIMYRAPELLPLVELLQRDPPFTLLLGQAGRVQVLEVDLGVTTPRAWVDDARIPQTTSGTLNSPGARSLAARPMVRLDSPVRLIQRSLAASSTPLLLAGDEVTLKKVADWLPQRAISRLIGTVAVPQGIDQREAVDLLRDRLAAIHADESLQLVSRVVTAIRTHGPAVAGHVATLEALCQGSVDTLLIAEGGRPESGALWDAKIELTRQACRQGTRVVLADSEELRYLGGVGCLLRQRHETRAMPVPTRLGHLDLVA